MTELRVQELIFQLPAGAFRALRSGTDPRVALFLHGLTGVAEVWLPTFEALGSTRTLVAIDQRGHGQSPNDGQLDYRIGAFVGDTRALVRQFGPIDLVGHSMGARVAMVFAARHPELVRSVAIVDIGPEASRRNIAETVSGIRRRPEQFEDESSALAFGFRNRTPTVMDRRIFLARLRQEPGGRLAWRASADSLVAIVSEHRRRNYWAEWRRLGSNALFVHGEASTEVSHPIADKMLALNPDVRFVRCPGVGHNIPLIAPEKLGEALLDHWERCADHEPRIRS